MAIPFSDNLSISGKYPDITRQEYATLADLKAVKKNRMPEMYFGYCLEDHKWYTFDKQNSEDSVTGYWREFTGGTTIQVETMPEADETQIGKIYQYIGATDDNYTNGYFYICAASGETQVVDITTLTDLKDTINESENNIEVNNGTETVETKVFTFDSVNYYVIEDVVYSTSNTSGDISVDTVLSTDEEVAALNLTKEIVVYTYSWSNKLVQPTAGGGDAKDIAYNNTDKPELTNVKLALDDLIAKVYYVEPQVTSFTMAPSTTDYEIGQSVSDIVFNWAYNKDMVSQTLTDCTLADETVRTATATGPYSANKTFTLSANDGEKSVTASKTISFKHKVYWGSAAETTYDSAFILALSGKKFATNYKGTYSMNVATGQYGYLAYPDSWGMVSTWWIGGFETETFDCGTVEFTNASGNTTTFRIVRTTQPGLGEIAPEVK